MSDIIVLDCDSMIYLACYKEPSLNKRKSKLMGDINQVQTSLGGDEIYPLLKGKGNFRYDVTPTYKSNRTNNKLDEEMIQLKEWVNELTLWAGENLGMACDNSEADDYVGILNDKFIKEGHTVIMSHIDKDLNQLVGHHHNFKKNEVYTIDPREGYHWLCKQTLMGDAADAVEGLKGIGIKTAEKMLAASRPNDWWELICNAYNNEFKDEWQEKLRICGNLVYMRTREEDLINLSFKQIKDIYTWSTTWGTGNSDPLLKKNQTQHVDSSTSSITDLMGDDTSERKPLQVSDESKNQEKSEPKSREKKVTGRATQAQARTSTKTSRSSVKKTSTL